MYAYHNSFHKHTTSQRDWTYPLSEQGWACCYKQWQTAANHSIQHATV